MSREELRQEMVASIDRLLSTPFIRNHMSHEDVRRAQATRTFWAGGSQASDDALDSILTILLTVS